MLNGNERHVAVNAFRSERCNHTCIADGFACAGDVQIGVQLVVEIAFTLARRNRVLDLFVGITFAFESRPKLRLGETSLG